MLKIEGLHKSYDGDLVLKNVSLTMDKNEILGLAGPSGSGKSTLMRCIQDLEKIDSGKIDVSGDTGFMFQDFQLFPHMTVLKNLTYAPSLKNPGKDHTARAREILKTLGIADKEKMYPPLLSGGQKQRVALARSLMMEPQILLCDEPTSGLDVATIGEVVSLLSKVHEMGVSMIIASHDLDFLTEIADRIILLKDGVIATDMNPKSVQDPVAALKKFYGP